ncbi:hypothetical protein Zm00014a_028580 [Zea mays]|uniref:Uncharacterized protein n=2 Tax=Zea mays TaxID=4577 RepID=B6T0E5_MAIZE|nr:hypothetical protein [Zea mays]PWZ38702.1 hypothetical protein Zm00014a_028580 [Zea mays]
MRALALTLPALVLAALLSCTPEVSAVRVPAATLADQTSNRRGASSPPAAAEQPTRKAASDDDAAAAAAAASSARASRLADASASWKAPAVAGGASYSPPPSAVFDPDRMSKRRVRRGSDPIHNKC